MHYAKIPQVMSYDTKKRICMKKIVLGLVCASVFIHATEKETVPTYNPGSFLEVLESRDVTRMLAFADDPTQKHLERWAMAAAATGHEKNGLASFWLARRLIPGQVDSILDSKLERNATAREVLGRHYILQAARQNDMAHAFYCEAYHDAPPAESTDTTLVAFRRLLEREHEFKAEHFRNHINHYKKSEETLLRALALTMIGLHRIPHQQNDCLSIVAAAFASHKIPTLCRYHENDYDNCDQTYKLFQPNASVALQYYPLTKVSTTHQTGDILWYADMAQATGNISEARRLYASALPNTAWGTKDRIEKYLQDTDPNSPQPAPKPNTNSCVIQ
jgi:hypothetical protein